ncbi:hypothetical protein PENSTE_c001G02381 [Penicillium steckii]|uniref:F-box domain-containing protein n=1 Tax=Penicillium steckii TaxID=303698 RepID=A0A1V6U1B8_9EURO|nr:hypothetical protein PENSTE_c001G02381 [Penicillium steckii]
MYTNDSHQQRALEIPEIVLSILSQMDLATLLTSQRVCHAWLNLIRESKTLQQNLYFLPSSHSHEGNDEPRYCNPLLADKFPFLKQIIHLENDQSAGFWNWRPWNHEWEDIKLRTIDLLRSPTKKEQYMRPEASWRRMLTHQPPLYTVGSFSGQAGRFGSSWRKSKAAEQSDGLQMEIMFYWVISLLSSEIKEIEVSIYIGRSLPADIKQGIEGATGRRCQMSDELNRMVRQFDIVLARKFPFSGCGYCDSDDEEVREPPTENEIVLEQLQGFFQEMIGTVHGLDFEIYNKGRDDDGY